MASLRSSTGGYNLSFLALTISVSVGYLIAFTPIPSPSDQNPCYPLINQPLRAIAFSSAASTYFLGMIHLLFCFSKPTCATAERISLATLSAAFATLVLGILFVLKTAALDSLDMCAGGSQGGGPINAVMNLFL